MGIQINGLNDNITSTDGSLTVTGYQLSGATNINTTGIITASTANFTGNVSIAGTLTYEDVTSVDSVGIITAQSDVSIADKIIHTGDTNTALRFPANDTFTVETAGSERLRITSGGQLLVNTTSNGGNAEPVLVVSGRANADTDSGIMHIKRGETAANMSAGDAIGEVTFTALDGGSAAQILVKAGAGWGGTSDCPGEMILATASDAGNAPTERLRIDSSGRILVGTDTAPTAAVTSSALFVVEGYTGVPTGDALISLQRGQAPASISSGAQLGGINFGANDGSRYAQIHVNSDGAGGTNDYPGRLVFSTTSDGSATPTERLRITSAGLVGLGTTDPDAFNPNADDLVIYGTGHQGLTIRSGTSHDGSIMFNDTDNANQRGIIRYVHTDDAMAFHTSGGEALRITSDGNVGIGEDNPDVRLHVKETIDTAYSLANVANEANHLLKLENPSTTANAFSGMQFRVGSGADLFFGAIQQSVNHGDFFFVNQNSPQKEMMRIKSTGNVGIGTDSPTDHLEILHTNGKGLTFKTTENHYAQITSDSNRSSANSHLLALEGHWNGTPVAEIALTSGSDDTNKDDGEIIFRTSSANNLNSSERLRITSDGYPWIQNKKTTSFTNGNTVTVLTIGDHLNAVVKFILHASDTGYRQNEWAGEYTAFVSNANGSPGVSYYLKEHWQDVGSGSWSSPTVTVSINGSGQVQFNADNSHNDANGAVYVVILSVTSANTTIPTIS